MDKHKQYVLLGNQCDHCQYIQHAFTLLRLPLNHLTFEELLKQPEYLQQSRFLLLCKEIEEQQGDQIYPFINDQETQLISFLSPDKDQTTVAKNLRHLNPYFSKYELKDVLMEWHGHDQETGDSYFKHPIFEPLIGNSQRICAIRFLIRQVAATDSTVLILGQSGTGKDIVASCIHYLSPRKEKNLVPINCGAIPSELIESELFGHEKGAFTGAAARRLGRFEIANKGTLFLDEIGDMPLPMQVKLLRVIQDRKVERVGGNESIKVDVRIIAATNKNLEKSIQQNRFREDLFYRLNVFPIQLPSLKERAEDIPALIDYHLDKIYNRLKSRVEFTENAIDVLTKYPWPGNIRELENFLERMVVIHRDKILDDTDLDAIYTQSKFLTPHKVPHALQENGPFDIKEYVASIERQAIEFALEHSNGLTEAAARYLSMGQKKLLEKMKKYQLV